jgi:hypothetical protein
MNGKCFNDLDMSLEADRVAETCHLLLDGRGSAKILQGVEFCEKQH